MGSAVVDLKAPERDGGSTRPSAARQPSYASTKPARLLQPPAFTIVSKFGHVGSCSPLKTPSRKVCCALATRGHDTAEPPSKLRTSLRLMGSPEFEEALRLRAGSLGIKVSSQER